VVAGYLGSLGVMNSTLPIDFQATYSRELIEVGAKCFVRHHFRHSGRWLLVACVVNALGFGALLWFDPKANLITALLGLLVVTGPLYCAYLFKLFPQRYASRLSSFLAPSARLSLNEFSLEISANGRKARVRWVSVKELLECPACFVLVIAPFAMLLVVVPNSSISADAHEFLKRKTQRRDA
jgi:hypothetical protein